MSALIIPICKTSLPSDCTTSCSYTHTTSHLLFDYWTINHVTPHTVWNVMAETENTCQHAEGQIGRRQRLCVTVGCRSVSQNSISRTHEWLSCALGLVTRVCDANKLVKWRLCHMHFACWTIILELGAVVLSALFLSWHTQSGVEVGLVTAGSKFSLFATGPISVATHSAVGQDYLPPCLHSHQTRMSRYHACSTQAHSQSRVWVRNTGGQRLLSH